MATLAGVMRRHTNTAYTVLQKSLQHEWAFVQHITLDIRIAFQLVEDELRETFLSDLFQGYTAQIPGREITGLPVKQTRIDIYEPTRKAGANWTASCIIMGNLVAALRGTAEFRLGDHALLMEEGREEI